MRYMFLPPYSPDYNPIELAFSSMKAWLRRNNGMVTEIWNDKYLVNQLLWRMAREATPEKAKGWFNQCNYWQE
jgi:hypothetical protein